MQGALLPGTSCKHPHLSTALPAANRHLLLFDAMLAVPFCYPQSGPAQACRRCSSTDLHGMPPAPMQVTAPTASQTATQTPQEGCWQHAPPRAGRCPTPPSAHVSEGCQRVFGGLGFKSQGWGSGIGIQGFGFARSGQTPSLQQGCVGDTVTPNHIHVRCMEYCNSCIRFGGGGGEPTAVLFVRVWQVYVVDYKGAHCYCTKSATQTACMQLPCNHYHHHHHVELSRSHFPQPSCCNPLIPVSCPLLASVPSPRQCLLPTTVKECTELPDQVVNAAPWNTSYINSTVGKIMTVSCTAGITLGTVVRATCLPYPVYGPDTALWSVSGGCDCELYAAATQLAPISVAVVILCMHTH